MKLIFPLSLCLFFCCSLTSQEALTEKKLHVGFSLTPQISAVAYGSEELHESKSNLSYTLGGNLVWSISEKVHLLSGVNFQSAIISQRDYTPMFPMDHMNGEALPFLSYYEYRVNYISLGIPLKANFLFGDGQNHPYFSLGGSINQIISSNEKLQLIESGILTHSLQGETHGIELDKIPVYISAGIGYDFQVGVRRIAVGPSFDYGIKSYLDIEENVSTPDYIGGNSYFFGIQILYY